MADFYITAGPNFGPLLDILIGFVGLSAAFLVLVLLAVLIGAIIGPWLEPRSKP